MFLWTEISLWRILAGSRCRRLPHPHASAALSQADWRIHFSRRLSKHTRSSGISICLFLIHWVAYHFFPRMPSAAAQSIYRYWTCYQANNQRRNTTVIYTHRRWNPWRNIKSTALTAVLLPSADQPARYMGMLSESKALICIFVPAGLPAIPMYPPIKRIIVLWVLLLMAICAIRES